VEQGNTNFKNLPRLYKRSWVNIIGRECIQVMSSYLIMKSPPIVLNHDTAWTN